MIADRDGILYEGDENNLELNLVSIPKTAKLNTLKWWIIWYLSCLNKISQRVSLTCLTALHILCFVQILYQPNYLLILTVTLKFIYCSYWRLTIPGDVRRQQLPKLSSKSNHKTVMSIDIERGTEHHKELAWRTQDLCVLWEYSFIKISHQLVTFRLFLSSVPGPLLASWGVSLGSPEKCLAVLGFTIFSRVQVDYISNSLCF